MSEFSDISLELISEFGKEIQIGNVIATYDVTNSTASQTTDVVSTKAVIENARNSQRGGELVNTALYKLTITANIVPTLEDKVIMDGIIYKITGINPVYYENDAVVYQIWISR